MKYKDKEGKEYEPTHKVQILGEVDLPNGDVQNELVDLKVESLDDWMTYKGKNGKIYYYTINGQNGKVCGELPVDYKKLSLVSALITGVVFLLGLAGGLLL